MAFSVACTRLVPANIRATTRRCRKVRHTQATLHHAIFWQLYFAIQAKWLLQSSLNLQFLFGAIFSTGTSPSNTLRIWKTENAGNYPIGIHHPWHVTNGSTMLPVGGVKNKQSLWRLQRREIIDGVCRLAKYGPSFIGSLSLCCVTRQKCKIIIREKNNKFSKNAGHLSHFAGRGTSDENAGLSLRMRDGWHLCN